MSNGSEESRKEQCYERATSKNEPGLFFIVGFFIVRNECLLVLVLWKYVFLLCWPRLKLVPPWTRVAELAPCFFFFFFFFWRSTSLSFRFAYSWPRLTVYAWNVTVTLSLSREALVVRRLLLKLRALSKKSAKTTDSRVVKSMVV